MDESQSLAIIDSVTQAMTSPAPRLGRLEELNQR
jgi:hypothetical protein